MPDEPSGLTMLEKRIEEFKQALEDMKGATSEAHSVLKQMREERRTIENLLRGDEVKKLVETRVQEIIVMKLDEIGPAIDKQTNLIYAKVGEQIDKIIDLSMGEEFSREHNRLNMRPLLAERMKIWIREVIDKEGYEGVMNGLV